MDMGRQSSIGRHSSLGLIEGYKGRRSRRDGKVVWIDNKRGGLFGLPIFVRKGFANRAILPSKQSSAKIVFFTVVGVNSRHLSHSPNILRDVTVLLVRSSPFFDVVIQSTGRMLQTLNTSINVCDPRTCTNE